VIDSLFDRGVFAGLGSLGDAGRHRVQVDVGARRQQRFFIIEKISTSSRSRRSIQTLRSLSPSPSKKARRTQRVTQWYQRVLYL
jgi:hypothetical protein